MTGRVGFQLSYFSRFVRTSEIEGKEHQVSGRSKAKKIDHVEEKDQMNAWRIRGHPKKPFFFALPHHALPK